MLSINIPVYNIIVNDLVTELKKQADTAGIDYEIRVYDDCSIDEIKRQNKPLINIDKVEYHEMPLNLGRASLRNKMGFDSTKEYLLFIDADSEIDTAMFIQNYIEHASPMVVLCGGTTYRKEKPAEPEKVLRWIYGTSREAMPALKRNCHKGFIITSNNFLISRQLFRTVHFRENLGPYGHEDTLLGYDLHRNGITLVHIENPVVHTGLEDAAIFIQKTEKALQNLKLITDQLADNPSDFIRQVKFLYHYKKLTKYVPERILNSLFLLAQPTIRKNLTGQNPKLFLFDMYKIGYYSTSCSRQKT